MDELPELGTEIFGYEDFENFTDFSDIPNDLNNVMPLENEFDGQKNVLDLQESHWFQHSNPNNVMGDETRDDVDENFNAYDGNATTVKIVKKSMRGRHRLGETEKTTRRKESNRRAAEKYRNKKKIENINIFERIERLKETMKELSSLVKDHLAKCSNPPDPKLLQSLKKVEHEVNLDC